MAFEPNVITECEFDALEPQVANKINDIAQTGGRGSHGPVMLTDGTECEHWRAGDYRIFGTYDDQAETFTVIGHGRHTGTGNRSYKVDLCAGGTTKAQTS